MTQQRSEGSTGEGRGAGGEAALTGLCRIMDTLFFCSIMLKSWRRSGAMFLSRRYSGLFSSTLSKYLSLWGAVVGGGEVTTAAWVSPFMVESSRFLQNKNERKYCFWISISQRAHPPDKHICNVRASPPAHRSHDVGGFFVALPTSPLHPAPANGLSRLASFFSSNRTLNKAAMFSPNLKDQTVQTWQDSLKPGHCPTTVLFWRNLIYVIFLRKFQ